MGTAAVGAVATAAGTRNNRAQRRHPVPAPSQTPQPAKYQKGGGQAVMSPHDDLLQSMLRQITENTRVQQETAVLVKGLSVRIDSLEESRKRDEDRRDRRQENAPEGVRGWMIVTISIVAVAISACSLLSVAVTVLPHLALH